jgi:hypothetical protein
MTEAINATVELGDTREDPERTDFEKDHPLDKKPTS